MSGPSAKIIAPSVSAICELAGKAGRNPAGILMFSMFTVILGRTEAEAKAKYADYRSHISPEGALTLMSGWTGVDFSTYDLDQQVRHVENDAGRTAMEVEVDVIKENPITGEQTRTNAAYLVYVAIDDNDKPARIPPLLAETPEEQARIDAAKLRQQRRLAQMANQK